ncbi:F5/8 type C domain containing protein [Carpediemonas membranifera]|uniref:F5/8 type C domain containing protein n=1 Tax=Carpediemonas membranifera TaxID=201153 RepID=A0A8J6ASU2_9EUKA|nr:F5/8 type C domain containing protein [Carpediemonas membranifera]|eukprot:KAG9393208.1 F5/8 type C domain containing protein [Carpediemonas membranifera]
MKNYSLSDQGASIHSFTSQYHHGCACENLLLRHPSLCWFTSVNENFPQSVVLDMGQDIALDKIGFFLHGENNQNPKHITFHLGPTPDEAAMRLVVDSELEHRGGDFLYPVTETARYVKYTITDNYGGSGSYTTKLFLFGSAACSPE